ncbi:MAG: anaerobic sulfatase maturase [Firmicutes bacterium]|nr:anaerobic sulfatase maturase [Bacillota bacterium]
MAKPIGPICNLDCVYCYYREKEGLYPKVGDFRMSPEVLESFIKQYIEAQDDIPEINFAWQGGEPTLLGVEFFEKAVELERKYCPEGKIIHNAFQTNGLLLDDEWGKFLKRHNFLVGISIDGPQHLHDSLRVGRSGAPSFDRVMHGLEVLKRHQVEFNALVAVNRINADHPLEVYHFLKDQGVKFMQFIPIVRRIPWTKGATAGEFQNETRGHIPSVSVTVSTRRVHSKKDGEVTPESVDPVQYGRFLCEIFDEWVSHDVGRYFVQIFEVALGIWLGLGSTLCVHAETCGRALVLEHNGDLFSCDHFVYPQYKLGNILKTPLRRLVNSDRQAAFGLAKKKALPRCCLECAVRFACNGGCLKDRFAQSEDGSEGLNYLCAGYKLFFNHIAPRMRDLAREIRLS